MMDSVLTYTQAKSTDQAIPSSANHTKGIPPTTEEAWGDTKQETKKAWGSVKEKF